MITPSPYILISPDTISVDEYADFTSDLSIVFEAPAVDTTDPAYVPEEITVLDPSVAYDPLNPHAEYTRVLHDVILPAKYANDTVRWIRTGDRSFTISGAFKDVFNRSIKYVNADGTKGEIPNFSHLPESYGAVYSYTPTTETQLIIQYTVRMRNPNAIISAITDADLDSYTGVIIIRNNWQLANSMFRQAIESGGFALQAKKNGF